MRKDRSSLRYTAGCAVVLLSLVGFAMPAFAQTPVGVQPVRVEQTYPSPSIGIEAGYGQHTQEGTFVCNCGSSYTGGSGHGYLFSLFFDLPFSRDFSAGLKVGLDFKNTTSSTLMLDTVVVEPASGQPGTAVMNVERIGSLNLTLLRFAPYIQYQLLHTEFFVQIGPGISYVLSTKLGQSRYLVTDSASLSDGSKVNNITFTDGTRTQTFDGGGLLSEQSLLFSAIVSAGFGFGFGDFVISPIVTYDLPLSNIQSNI